MGARTTVMNSPIISRNVPRDGINYHNTVTLTSGAQNLFVENSPRNPPLPQTLHPSQKYFLPLPLTHLQTTDSNPHNNITNPDKMQPTRVGPLRPPRLYLLGWSRIHGILPCCELILTLFVSQKTVYRNLSRFARNGCRWCR